MKKRLMNKRVPRLRTDEQAEAFLARDLSHLDFAQFKPAHFEFEKKDEQINMRVPKPLLAAVKARAKARGIPYTRFIRETLEQAVGAVK
jgi:predicted DNA binding CopG/RHH family protein